MISAGILEHVPIDWATVPFMIGSFTLDLGRCLFQDEKNLTRLVE